uniref:Uncharacterized protein n=2 Tax=Pseudo-nitzschia australis TaxID=44445 RepID=A0A7S4EM18_9STRA|mmetsp:Transcript_25567/g.56014  ORF Transcript_25567/g.56014 Transcript_25567/m.56014 type:complete len:765 (-) Transcript_25567:410-2704(-)|eukprot:CAMPEP_0168168512 /NCGR_PEP_ID=MMETSP0139_2-20121125/3133_1 /TAXON_ID=44445 /ORGANISM="Pseudo-nitzschia australis, Strain 10249 10 AB" /LENGTH=764 /DNA_ID=CAMNT_0008085847 /DNA_START=135 /DNA_END=2429 /DNA_ORIENTATION=+
MVELKECKRYTFQKCSEMYGLTIGDNATTDDIANAQLLCGVGELVPSEKINAAVAAVFLYLISNIYIQIAESSLHLKRSRIWGTNGPYKKEGSKAILYAAVLHGSIGLLLYVVTIIAIPFATSPLDNRTSSIVVGISQFFASIVFYIMSLSVPQWFGVYHSRKIVMISFTSSREIQFTLAWNMWKQLISMYFFTLYFLCVKNYTSVVYGIVVGIPAGYLSMVITKQARSTKYSMHKTKIAIFVILILLIASGFTVWEGTQYILTIWVPDDSTMIATYCLLVWVVVMVGSHIFMYQYTKVNKSVSMRFKSEIFNQPIIGDLVNDLRMEELVEGDEESFCSNGDVDVEGQADENKAEGDVKEQAVIEDTPSTPVATEKKKSDPIKAEGTEAAAANKSDVRRSFVVESKEGNEILDNFTPKRRIKFTEEAKFKTAATKNQWGYGYVAPEDAPTYWKLFISRLADTFPCLCGCFKKEYLNASRRRLDFRSNADVRSKSTIALKYMQRFVWYFMSLAALFFTIVNILATREQCKARSALVDTFEVLYPPDYLTGKMCAWDKPGPNATIKTFESPQDAENANFEIVHCGACGNCSNWNDITLQYTSREVLAAVSKKCTVKSIGKKFDHKDPNDAVVRCNMETIGFTLPCSQAWAWDMINTKNHGIFTFLQANVANFVSDMNVTYQDITLATIDEAISGQIFVPLVGATRRRMNIISDISRPTNQQCSVVKQNWSEVFPDEFKPPVGGSYTIQPPGKPSYTKVIVGQDTSP